MFLRGGICIIGLALTLTSCATHQGAKSSRSWDSKHLSSHPLIGKIWDVRAGRFIYEAELKAQLAGVEFLLLGEIHDNPDHHRMQAELLRFVAATQEPPSVVMEQIDFEQAKDLDSFMAKPERLAEDLGPAIGWEKTGWPEWENYLPIGEVIVEEQLKLYPGNYSKSQVRTISQGMFRSLPGALRKAGTKFQPVPKKLEDSMLNDLVEAHCGLLSRDGVRPMLQVQWSRDRLMTNQLVKAKYPAVLIAGNGHIQSQYGVAYHLKKRNPGFRLRSVAIVEVRPDQWRPEAYNDGYDFIWFTPVYNPQDRCEALKAHFSSRHQGEPQNDEKDQLEKQILKESQEAPKSLKSK